MILEDCPFCGSPGISFEHKEMKGCWIAGCIEPDCIAHQVAFDFDSQESAVAAWNTRSLDDKFSKALKTFAKSLLTGRYAPEIKE